MEWENLDKQILDRADDLKPRDLFKLLSTSCDLLDTVVLPWLEEHFDTLMPEEVCLLAHELTHPKIAAYGEAYLRDNLS